MMEPSFEYHLRVLLWRLLSATLPPLAYILALRFWGSEIILSITKHPSGGTFTRASNEVWPSLRNTGSIHYMFEKEADFGGKMSEGALKRVKHDEI